MTTPRCLVKGCPVRFAQGDDRFCRGHADDDSGVNLSVIARGFGVTMTAFDGDSDSEQENQV